MYASEIDEREKQLGFVRDRVPNGSGFYQGKEEYVYAVVYSVDSENIIIKERCPLGGYRYSHRAKDETAWKIVCNTERDPHQAILNAREHINSAKELLDNQ